MKDGVARTPRAVEERHSLRAWLGRLGLVLAGTRIGLLAAEGLVRVFFP